MHRLWKKVVSLHAKACENGMQLGNSNKFDCSRFAPFLSAKEGNLVAVAAMM